MTAPAARFADPVTLEIVKNALASIADEMALVVLRSAFSPIVRDSMDYSTALFDHRGRLIAQGLTNPIHLGSFSQVLSFVLERFGDTMRPGDGFMTNDPYGSGGMHLPDIYLIRPLFHDGTLEAFAAVLVHHADIGGMAPGSMALHATDVFQEGLRLPLFKAWDAGRPNVAALAILSANSRMPDQLEGDLRAQVAACTAAERAMADLLARHGATAFRGMVEELHDYAERLVRERISAMPDGVYAAEDFIDGLGEEGEPIRFNVALTIAGDTIAMDWTGTSSEVQGAINGPVAVTYSICYAALRCAIGIQVPNCEGYTRPVTMHAPLGSIVNPRPPAACAARGVMAYRMLDTLFAAFAQIVPDRIPAAGEGGPSAISISGMRDGRQWLVTEGVFGSWGGRAGRDGVDGIANPGGNLSNQPIELIEARLPVRVEQYGLVRDSGGAGATRGGLAVTRSYRVLDQAAALTVRSDRRRFLPPGLQGGGPGSPSLNILERNGQRTLLPVMPLRTIPLQRNDLFIHVAPGAAGRGDPLTRAPEAVRADVLDGKLTAAYARDAYGVMLDEAGLVDEAATARLRPDLAARATPLAASLAGTQARHFFAETGIAPPGDRP